MWLELDPYCFSAIYKKNQLFTFLHRVLSPFQPNCFELCGVIPAVDDDRTPAHRVEGPELAVESEQCDGPIYWVVLVFPRRKVKLVHCPGFPLKTER